MSAFPLSPQQQTVFDAYLRGENIMLSGQAGSGKSHVIKKIVAHLLSTNTDHAVCAMTGCAAVVLECKATTLHSFAGVGLASGAPDTVVHQTLHKKHVVRRWKMTRVLIVDEVSAMSKKLFDIIEEIARRANNSRAPFGGIQVIFVGDFHQLPPVGGQEPSSSAFCFESDQWSFVFPLRNHFDLLEVYRQTDHTYKRLLSQIRKGVIDDAGIDMLAKRVGVKPGECATRIFPLRASVDFMNRREYTKLKTPEEVFQYTTLFATNCFPDTELPIPADVARRCAALSADERDTEYKRIIESSRAPLTLSLKIGCVVMCTANLDMKREICNGSQGIVTGFVTNVDGNRIPVVQFRNGTVMHIAPKLYPSEDFPCLYAGQLPLIHAWAVTVHKCQGIGLDCAEMDIGRTIFEYNQTYVALSRVRTLEGLFLTSFDPTKIRTQPKVLAFYDTFPAPVLTTVCLPPSPPSVDIDETKDPDPVLPDTSRKIISTTPDFARFSYAAKSTTVVRI